VRDAGDEPARSADQASEPRPLLARRLGRLSYARGLELQQRLVAKRQAGLVPTSSYCSNTTPSSRWGATHVASTCFSLRSCCASAATKSSTADVAETSPSRAGQIVGYPILELPPARRDVHRYVRELEEVMIRTCGDYGIAAERVAGLTGTWVGTIRSARSASGSRAG